MFPESLRHFHCSVSYKKVQECDARMKHSSTTARPKVFNQNKSLAFLRAFPPSWPQKKIPAIKNCRDKKLQTRKPDFVSKLSFIWDKHYCLPLSAYPGPSDEQPSGDPIHGISAPKVYPPGMLPCQDVGSYPTFSPLFHLSAK